METQNREYVATLCALSTVGASATGLAFGFREDAQATTFTSAKRKAPGTDRSSAPLSDNLHRSTTARRVVSQPVSGTASTEGEDKRPRRSTSRSLFRRRTLLDVEQLSSNTSNSTISRGSSVSGNRRAASRVREQNNDGKESAGGSAVSWLRRISTISSLSSLGPSSRPDTPSISLSSTPATPMLVDGPQDSQLTPNKLVKRSSSHRVLSSDQSRLPALRRPATSHQRAAHIRRLSLIDISNIHETTSSHVWRPYFDSASPRSGMIQPRKRHTSRGLGEVPVRTISDVRGLRPTLLLGTSVIPRAEDDDIDDIDDFTDRRTPNPRPLLRHKKRLGSRRDRRIATDPVIRPETTPEIMLGRSRSSPLSPISHLSSFDVELPRGTPAFSDPTTASSDRVFTDDESMDFQSDTAYDSLATRATASSHSGLRGLQIETIFDESSPPRDVKDLVDLKDLIGGNTIEKNISHRRSSMSLTQREDNTLKIARWEEHASSAKESWEQMSTPPDTDVEVRDEYMTTPVPIRVHKRLVDIHSSPPSIATPRYRDLNMTSNVRSAIVAPTFKPGDVDWDKASDSDSIFDEFSILPELPKSNGWASEQDESSTDSKLEDGASHSRKLAKRPSIFDWSEHHKLGIDTINGSSPRPKTVHGKQGADGRGSRATGRRGPSAMHLRSQSVPVTRELNHDNEPAYTAAKFGTWGLGNKGVSEEWSDDFDFDDLEDPAPAKANGTSTANGSLRAMKVPQAIIDRQASVRGQFGQVQEFRRLVEELKRLRLQGSTLQLLETQSKHLWEDADSIINLATLDDDEDDARTPQSPISPTSFDGFEEETPPPRARTQPNMKVDDDGRRPSVGRRSISNPATPPVGRPRGESVAQTKSFLQSIQQNRNALEPPPAPELETYKPKKLPFDTQDLRELVIQAGVITRNLKEIVRKAEGVSVSPTKSPRRLQDPPFSQIFHQPDQSPSPPSQKPILPKSRSANSYLGGVTNGGNEKDLDLAGHMKMLTVV